MYNCDITGWSIRTTVPTRHGVKNPAFPHPSIKNEQYQRNNCSTYVITNNCSDRLIHLENCAEVVLKCTRVEHAQAG